MFDQDEINKMAAEVIEDTNKSLERCLGYHDHLGESMSHEDEQEFKRLVIVKIKESL